MGHIKEPKGVDFIIESEPLDDVARKEISDFIKRYKDKIFFPKKLEKANKMLKTAKLPKIKQ